MKQEVNKEPKLYLMVVYFVFYLCLIKSERNTMSEMKRGFFSL